MVGPVGCGVVGPVGCAVVDSPDGPVDGAPDGEVGVMLPPPAKLKGSSVIIRSRARNANLV